LFSGPAAIAETLGLTVVNVKMRVHRARLFLRKRLEAHFSIARVDNVPGVQLVDAAVESKP